MNGNFDYNNIEKLYPDIYEKVKPYIDDILSRLDKNEIDEETFEQIVRDILIRSGLWGMMQPYSMPSSTIQDSLPVQLNFDPFGGYWGQGFGMPWWWNNNRRRRRWPPYYPPCRNCRLTPEDIIRILLIQRLWGGYTPYF